MVNYHGLVTCSLEYPHRMCTGRTFSYQQQHSCAELSTQFTHCQLSDHCWFQRTPQSCWSAVSWLASVQPTGPFPPHAIQCQPENSSQGFWLKVPMGERNEPWSILDSKTVSQDSWMEPGRFDLNCFKCLCQNVSYFPLKISDFPPYNLFADTIFLMS